MFNIAQVAAAAQELLGAQDLPEPTRAFIESLSEPGSGITQPGDNNNNGAATSSTAAAAAQGATSTVLVAAS